MPVTEASGLVALLYLNQEDAREWSASELDFVRDVAARTRIAVERRRAEQKLEQLANSLERQVSERTAEVNRLWRNARDLVIYGLAGVSFCQFTYFLTIQLSSAGVGTILQDLSPVLILLVVCIQQKRAPRLFEVFSIVLALGGVFMLTTHGSLTNMAVSPAALVVGIISAFCVVIYTIWPQNLQKQYPTPMLQGWAFLMGGTFFALVFRPWRINYVPNAAGIAGIAAVVLIGNVLAFSCYMSGVKYIGPQKSSLFSFAEPVTAAIISTLVLGSPFTMWDAIGFVCIFLMLVLLFISNEKQAKSAASA